MKTTLSRSPSWKQFRQGLVAVVCAASILPGQGWLLAQTPIATPTPAPAVPAEPEEPKIPPEQLDALVAPIALYPDPLLAQTLVASTYPLEIIQLQQWMAKNKNLKDKALADAVAKQPWDPAIQSMASVPDVVTRLAGDLQWTTELGNAFLAQQSDVMDAVQRMRKKAQDTGALKTNEQQKVETQVVEQKTVIVVEQTSPEYIYVPSYNPTVVYGPPVYAYPPIYYPPPPPPGSAFVTFGVGVMVGAAIWGNNGYGCGWGGNDVNINVNKNYNNINNVGGAGGGNNWSHNAQHRGGTPYSSNATASKYGGTSSRSSASANQAGARPTASSSSRPSPSGNQAGSRPSPSSSQASSRPSPNAGSSSSRPSPSSGSGGNSARPSSSASSQSSGGFGGGSSGFSGSSARSSSARGASSMGSRGGGGRR